MEAVRHAKRVVLVTLLCFGVILPSLPATAKAPQVKGLINIDYTDAEDEAKVEINLRGSMLALLAKGIKKRNPQGSEFLESLTAANVRVYDESALGGRNFAEVQKFYKQQMSSQWETLSRTKDEQKRIAYGIYSLAEGDVVSGLVVLVESDIKREFAVVNLVGKIDITKLSQLDKITGVSMALPDFQFEGGRLPPEKQEKREERIKRSITSFLADNHYQAITSLEKLDAEGLGSSADYASMAVLYHTMGALDKSYYYLGRLYELQNEKDISAAFYKKAVEINPESEAVEKLRNVQ